MGTRGTRQTLEPGEQELGGRGTSLAGWHGPRQYDPLGPPSPHPLRILGLPAWHQVSERRGAQGATLPGTEPPLTWLEGVSQEEP